MNTSNTTLVKLEHYCAYQERCHFEVEQKAKSIGLNKEEINQALYHLIQNDYLNEERFAELYARSKMNQKKWGPIKIKQGLYKKRVSSQLINKTLLNLSSEVLIENALYLCHKTFKSEAINKADFNQMAKLRKLLYSKGYESSIIAEVIKEPNL